MIQDQASSRRPLFIPSAADGAGVVIRRFLDHLVIFLWGGGKVILAAKSFTENQALHLNPPPPPLTLKSWALKLHPPATSDETFIVDPFWFAPRLTVFFNRICRYPRRKVSLKWRRGGELWLSVFFFMFSTFNHFSEQCLALTHQTLLYTECKELWEDVDLTCVSPSSTYCLVVPGGSILKVFFSQFEHTMNSRVHLNINTSKTSSFDT